MGVIPKKSSNKHYYKIVNGVIVQEWSKKPTLPEGTVIKEREDKKGNKKYFIETGGLVGRILDLKISTTDFGDFLDVEIGDKDGLYVLSITVDSKYFRDFALRLPNVDPEKDITINSYSFDDKEKEGRKVQGFTITQDGDKIARYYTKDNPNGLPDLEKKRKGKDFVWDSTNQVNFLYDVIEKYATRLDPFAVTPANSPEDSKEPAEAEENDTNFDDLPF